MKQSLRHKLIDRFASFERWVELNKRLGPQSSRSEFTFYVFLDSSISNIDKTGHKRCVITDQTLSKCEYIQQADLPPEEPAPQYELVIFELWLHPTGQPNKRQIQVSFFANLGDGARYEAKSLRS